jgi:hypothetical protein
MRKINLVLALSAALLTQPVLADEMEMSDSKPCATIASACKSAGFTKGGDKGKMFWMDCMKPVVMGQSVKGVTVDAATVKSCRTDKIARMQKEITELQNVK